MTKATDLEIGLTLSSSLGTSKEAAPVTVLDDDTSSMDIDTSSDASDDLGSEQGWDSDEGTPNTPEDNPLTVRYCACFPEGETEEECKARITRIAEMQQKCHG